MKNILIFSMLVFFSSCSKEDVQSHSPEYPNLRLWAIVICGGEMDYNETTPVEWQDKIIDILETKHFTVESHDLGFIEQENFVGCGNCRRTGYYLDISVPENQREALMKLGFMDK